MSQDSPKPQSGVAALVNTGVHILNDVETLPAERTLIVLGIARSGTTMVAGALHHLGVHVAMGKQPNGVFEDTEIAALLERKDYKALESLVQQRNLSHPVWGWKLPAAVDEIAQIERYFRAPEYIVVFRDLFAIANRNRISVRSELSANMRDVHARYNRLLSFLEQTGRRTMLVSYEKAMLDREAFVKALSQFAAVGGDEALRQAEAHVQRDSPNYLRGSRNWGGLGHLTVPTHQIIGGWAYIPGQLEPVMIEIEVNGRPLCTIRADLPIDELKRRGHPTGLCGFHLSLPKPWHLKAGDVVNARIAGDSAELIRSPWTFAPAEVAAAVPTK